MAKYQVLAVIVFFLGLFSFNSCNKSFPALPEEESMMRLLSENPDSLAGILERMDISQLTEKQRADYGWWLVSAHKKQRRNLVNDTIIHSTLDFYKRINSPRLLGAYLLAAEQVDWTGTAPAEKGRLLDEVLDVSIEIGDTAAIQKNISVLFKYNQLHKDRGRTAELLQLLKKYSSNKPSISAYHDISKMYQELEHTDSALYYLNKAIDLAVQEDELRWAYGIYRNYVTYLNDLGESRKALEVLGYMEATLPVYNDIRFSYIPTWINLGEFQKARTDIKASRELIEAVKEQGNELKGELVAVEAMLGFFESIVDIKEGKILTTSHLSPTLNGIIDITRNSAKVEQERQFLQNRLIQENLELEVKRARLTQQLLVCIACLVLLIATLVFIYQRKLISKQRLLQQAEDRWHQSSIELAFNESLIKDNEKLIGELTSRLDVDGGSKQEVEIISSENEVLKQSNRQLREDIESYSKILKKLNVTDDPYRKLIEKNARLEERDRFLTARLLSHIEVLDQLDKKPRYIENSKWPEVEHMVNQVFDGFTIRLHTDFPNLTQEDLRYCCLFKLRISTSVVALLMGISPSSVTKRKQRIKEKMIQHRPSCVERGESLEIYLWNY